MEFTFNRYLDMTYIYKHIHNHTPTHTHVYKVTLNFGPSGLLNRKGLAKNS